MVGLVTVVYGMAEVVVDNETENQLNFEIMDERSQIKISQLFCLLYTLEMS